MFVLFQAIGATFAAMIGAGMLVRSISYEHSPVPKHLAWLFHAGVKDNINDIKIIILLLSQKAVLFLLYCCLI